MKKILFAMSLSLFASSIFASRSCTDQPKEKWMSVDEFKSLIESKGFVIRKFKQPGNCYEIYGKDKDGREVEVYFNPVDASISKIEFED